MLTALKIARASLPAHSHKNSPKKFTQHQLFACLVLKNFLRTDYRGLVESLADCDSLCQAIELESVPHFTTFQKAAKRLLVSKSAKKLLDQTVREQMQRKTYVNEAAIDSTGLNATSAVPTLSNVDRTRKARGKPLPTSVTQSLELLSMSPTISSSPLELAEARTLMLASSKD